MTLSTPTETAPASVGLAAAPPDLAKTSDASTVHAEVIKGDKLAVQYKDVTLGEAEPLKAGLWDIFKKRADESHLHYLKRLCTEGHSVPDAFLTVASSQIGQIMLTCPNALWKAGVISGGMFAGVTMVWSLFSTFIMNVLYMERKRTLIKDGRWAKASQTATQYHDVLGFHAGKTVRYIAQTIIALQLLGTGTAQVIACAADWYSVDRSMSKRQLQIIWGAALQLFVLFPSFSHFRVLNIVALVGTTMTAIYIMHVCRMNGYADISLTRLWPEASATASAPQYFFTGSAVLMNALGGHAIAMEMMDVMETPKQYTSAYSFGWLWTIFLVVPHSITVNLSFPSRIGGADNVYGLLPMSQAKKVSVCLMIVHQLAAFAYYVVPLMFMWERVIGTHNKPWYIRLPSRLPVSLLIWLIATGMAFPFYGAINSLMSAISVPFTAFALPFFVYVKLYRNKEARDNSPLPPMKFLQAANWTPVFTMCVVGFLFYVGFGVTAVAYSLKTIVDNSRTFGLFARCYQCPQNYLDYLTNPGNGL